jgi:hypothetical protein
LEGAYNQESPTGCDEIRKKKKVDFLFQLLMVCLLKLFELTYNEHSPVYLCSTVPTTHHNNDCFGLNDIVCVFQSDAIMEQVKRTWYSGSMFAFQANDAGSIPAVRISWTYFLVVGISITTRCVVCFSRSVLV